MFSRWEDNAETEDDGSLFVDADPEVFAILLSYMRRPAIFPLFFTSEKGFDHALYTKLYAEADYFGLDDLCEWIRKRKYIGYKEEWHLTQATPPYTEPEGPIVERHTSEKNSPFTDTETTLILQAEFDLPLHFHRQELFHPCTE
ncbi:hypothetical protein BS50DRAFT_638994 [Corynespora cassiicola Philippines]|uniref:Potassium channel tetramerisation-type BTB domain-containing protein n=1 Tax=Corynespora cassiicola Philippines TaxID=1448308 RepID=A0A2T2N8E9_CORCC|nr:hypothetical protein BS50DRAFT_638994 [Corynespora cassiicola Philippines]